MSTSILIQSNTTNPTGIIHNHYFILNGATSNVVFVGYFNANIFHLAKSTNSGISWSVSNFPAMSSTPGYVNGDYDELNNTLHICYKGAGTSLMYAKSIDEGVTFTTAIDITLQTGVTFEGNFLAIAGYNNRVAILMQQNTLLDGSSDARVNESTDGGVTWTQIFIVPVGGNGILNGINPRIKYDKFTTNDLYFTRNTAGGGNGMEMRQRVNNVFSQGLFTTTLTATMGHIDFIFTSTNMYIIFLRQGGPTNSILSQRLVTLNRPLVPMANSRSIELIETDGVLMGPMALGLLCRAVKLHKSGDNIYVAWSASTNTTIKTGYFMSQNAGVSVGSNIVQFEQPTAVLSRHGNRIFIEDFIGSCYFEEGTNSLYFLRSDPVPNLGISPYLPDKYDQLTTDVGISALKTDNDALRRIISSGNPTVSDDNTRGHQRGRIWVNRNNSTAYICCNNVTNAAVWKRIDL